MVGWINNKAGNLISATDNTQNGDVKIRVQSTQVEVIAPELVVNYNKYMRGDI
jgi:hypothetical protein